MSEFHDVPFISFLIGVYVYGFLIYIVWCFGMYFKATIFKENNPSDHLLGLIITPIWPVFVFFMLFGKR